MNTRKRAETVLIDDKKGSKTGVIIASLIFVAAAILFLFGYDQRKFNQTLTNLKEGVSNLFNKAKSKFP